jgi:2-polyprenyl-3-methyl-5-hydroxy-6-metoxy-1,4-benzoquinol methylase
LIVLKDVIEHVEDRPALFSMMEQLLRPGGRVFMAFPPGGCPLRASADLQELVLVTHSLLPSVADARVPRGLSAFAEKPARHRELARHKRTGPGQ